MKRSVVLVRLLVAAPAAFGQKAAYLEEIKAAAERGWAQMEALPNTFGLQLDGSPDRVGYAKWRLWEEVSLDN